MITNKSLLGSSNNLQYVSAIEKVNMSLVSQGPITTITYVKGAE